ncbi:MAG TPA: hypothetical protein VNW97_18475 [Candidatus Saccharimonadales bacterium]|jgi:hypothetical protein|nr:hypothetical protein [Candidatus Saccharimonadales bacterium]
MTVDIYPRKHSSLPLSMFFASLAVVMMFTFAMTPQALAQTEIGGHVGFVLPLVTRAGGDTTTIGDNFGIGFPIGVTFKGKGRMALDMEFVPSIQNEPRQVSLLVHPGLIWSVGRGYSAGVRAAFDVNSSQFGFTPLLNKSWKFANQDQFFKAYFAEAVLPVRFNRPTGGIATNPVTFGIHFGLGF